MRPYLGMHYFGYYYLLFGYTAIGTCRHSRWWSEVELLSKPYSRPSTMCTRSSPTQSKEDSEVTGNQVVSEPASVTSTRCHWFKDDDINLITYLIEHKSKAGNSATFRVATWRVVSKHLEKTRTKGGPKHHKACSNKWVRVCKTLQQWWYTLICFHSSRSNTTLLRRSRECLVCPGLMKQASASILIWRRSSICISRYVPLFHCLIDTDHQIRQTPKWSHIRIVDFHTSTSWARSCPQQREEGMLFMPYSSLVEQLQTCLPCRARERERGKRTSRSKGWRLMTMVRTTAIRMTTQPSSFLHHWCPLVSSIHLPPPLSQLPLAINANTLPWVMTAPCELVRPTVATAVPVQATEGVLVQLWWKASPLALRALVAQSET